MTGPTERMRRMRARRSAALERGVAAILDLGSAKISCVLLKFDQLLHKGGGPQSDGIQPRLQILGAATVESRGIRCGEIRDRHEVETTIMRVLTRAQRWANTRVDHAFVCTSGGLLESHRPVNTIMINSHRISATDVARVFAKAKLPELPDDRTFLSVQPVNYSIDHRYEITDPRELKGNSLSVDIHAVSAASETVDTIIRAVEKCNLDVCGILSSAHASSLSALVEGEQNLGAACIDIGAGVTSIAVYYKKHVVFSKTIGLGGRFVTTDICNALSVGESEAERMKTVHGSLFFEPRDDEEMITFQSVDGRRNSISKAQLTFFIKPRMEEILETVSEVLSEIDFNCLPGQGIVLTGGCSQMQDLDCIAREILGPHVRFGVPIRLSGLPQEISGPQYSAVVGACLYALVPQVELSDLRAVDFETGRKKIGKTLQWIVANW